jgi:RimJ/RimL family protein N-acetyltransferase
MTHWIQHPLTLSGNTVDLISLGKEHFSQLEALAKDRRIWEYYTYDGSNSSRFREILESALTERQNGTQFPFVIFHKAENRIIGSTRFLDIQFQHRKLEIGATWLDLAYWGTEVNLECKLMLLTFCFDALKAYRVQLKTDENNIRSRKAIEKIGGQFEGILRNDMVRDNHTKRNSAYYSLIDQEWEEKKVKLMNLYNDKLNSHV